MPSDVKVTQLCLTLCHPMDYTVHGILLVRILEWVAFPFFRGSSQLRDQIQISHIAGGFFTSLATREAQTNWAIREALNICQSQVEFKVFFSSLQGWTNGSRSMKWKGHRISCWSMQWGVCGCVCVCVCLVILVLEYLSFLFLFKL